VAEKEFLKAWSRLTLMSFLVQGGNFVRGQGFIGSSGAVLMVSKRTGMARLSGCFLSKLCALENIAVAPTIPTPAGE